jgi:MazG family protein
MWAEETMASDTQSADTLVELLQIMRRLRDPETGCPWDRQQTHRSIARYVVEEAYELMDTIERNDTDELCDELGDLLFQVVFHAQMSSESGAFDFHDVAHSICEKLVRRHPHVFGDQRVDDADHQTTAWESHKAAERHAKGRTGLFDDVPVALPALDRAGKLQKRAARIGFDWHDAQGVLAKVREELNELEHEIEQGDAVNIEHELGDLLFSCVNLARKLDVDSAPALRGANRKFERRMACMESLANAQSVALDDLPLDQLDALWEEAKSREPGADSPNEGR